MVVRDVGDRAHAARPPPRACRGGVVRVLLVAQVDMARPGGLETHVRELALALGARGHAVEVLGRPAALPPLVMTDRLEPGRHDIVHHHGGTWPAHVPVGPGYVRTLHWCTAAKMATYVRLGRVQTLANPGNWRDLLEERRAVRRAGAVIAVSERVRQDFARFHGLDPARARVIPNGVAAVAPRGTRAALRSAWSIPPDAPVLLTIGRPDFVKGFDLLARAWHAALRPAGALWVTVGGARPERAPGRLVTGPLAHADVADWIHAADLGALPSYYEGCSVALLEMLEGGLFTLASDVGNAAEVIAPGVTGALVPRDALAWSAAITRWLPSPPPRGPGLPDRFHWPGIAQAVEEVYVEVTSGPGT
jgi:glycosyltransferase involved in cell wall biosynthesis